MKKFILILVALFSLNSVTYASFPVTEYETEQSTEQSTEENSFVNDLELPNLTPVYGGGPGFGIAALCCGILGIFFMGYLLGPLAIVFGALGLQNDGRGMAITGLVLGSLVTLLWLILLVFVGVVLAGGGVM